MVRRVHDLIMQTSLRVRTLAFSLWRKPVLRLHPVDRVPSLRISSWQALAVTVFCSFLQAKAQAAPKSVSPDLSHRVMMSFAMKPQPSEAAARYADSMARECRSLVPSSATDLEAVRKLQDENKPSDRKPMTTEVRELMSLNTKRQMFVDYQPAQNKQTTFVLLHGLGDDLTKLDAVAQQFTEKGFGVLRVDLQGHGETLKAYLAQNKEIPLSINYRDSVADIQEVIERLGLQEVSLLGHSYGGGIAYALAVELQKSARAKPVRVRSLHLLAPYVQRIDKFVLQGMKDSRVFVDWERQFLLKMGFPPSVVMNFYDSYARILRDLARDAESGIDAITGNADHESSSSIDETLSPEMLEFLKKAYRNYFILATNKAEEELTKEEQKQIQIKITSAIAVTRGILGFNLLDHGHPLEIPKDVPIHILGGGLDHLVLPSQLEEFFERLDEAKAMAVYEQIYKGTHFFITLELEETMKRVFEFEQKYRDYIEEMASEQAGNSGK